MNLPTRMALALVLASPPAAQAAEPPRITASDADASLVAGLRDDLAAAQRDIETFFGQPFARAYEVQVFPGRKALDEAFARRWQVPQTECWIVAAGVGDGMLLLSPRVWKSEACEHDGSDGAHVREIVTHELVHVYHGQRNPSPEFEGQDDIGWFAEGLATLVSGQLARAHRGAALEAIASGQAPRSLARAWSGRYRYGVSGSLVEYVDRRWGRATVFRLLGATTQAQVLELLATSEPALLAGWAEDVSARRP